MSDRLYDIISGKLKGDGALDALKKTDTDTLKKFVSSNNLTGSQIAKLTPGGYGANKLGMGANIRAMGAQTRQLGKGGLKNVPGNVFRAGLRGMSESGGGFRAGTGTMGRYLPMGAKMTALTTALPGINEALKREDPTGAGRSQTERITSSLGEVAGNVLASLPNSVTNRLGYLNIPLSFGAGVLGGSVGKRLGSAAGKAIDKGVSSVRGVQAGDITNAPPTVKRKSGSGAI